MKDPVLRCTKFDHDPRLLRPRPVRNKYRSRKSSLCAEDSHPETSPAIRPLAEYTGHFGSPGPFGSPLRAKFAQYFCICSLSCRSSGLHATPALESSCPNTYSISARVVRAQLRAFRIGRRPQVKAITIDRLLAGLGLRFHPLPCGERNEAVAREILRGTQRLFLRVGGIELAGTPSALSPNSFCAVAFRVSTVGFWGDEAISKLPSSWFHPASNGTSFCFPAAKMAGTGSGRKYPSTSGPKSKPSDCGGEKASSNFCAGMARNSASVLTPSFALTSLRIFFFARRARLERQASAEERRAALANRLLEQTLRQRRGHLRAHRKRSGAFAEDGHIARIAAERRNVVMHPVQRRHLIEQAVIARRIPPDSFASSGCTKNPKMPRR